MRHVTYSVTFVNEKVTRFCGPVARMSAAICGNDIEAQTPPPDVAEPVIGPATSGRTRWLIRATVLRRRGRYTAALAMTSRVIETALLLKIETPVVLKLEIQTPLL